MKRFHDDAAVRWIAFGIARISGETVSRRRSGPLKWVHHDLSSGLMSTFGILLDEFP